MRFSFPLADVGKLKLKGLQMIKIGCFTIALMAISAFSAIQSPASAGGWTNTGGLAYFR